MITTNSIQWWKTGYLAVVTALLVAAGSSSDVLAGPNTNPGTQHAVLIGISDYPAPFEDLQYCDKDVLALRDALVEAGFPQDHVICLHNGADDTNLMPTRANMLRQLELRLQLAESQDMFLVAFAGHGVVSDQKSYLCPGDAQWNDLSESCIAVDQIYQLMAQCPAEQKMLILDTGRKDRMFRGFHISAGMEGFGRDLPEPARGLRVLAACQDGQLSLEDEQLGHGLFMNYLCEGLTGLADQQVEGNRNGLISLEELYAYSYQQTRERAATWFNARQQPSMRGEHVGLYNLGGIDTSTVDQLAAIPTYQAKSTFPEMTTRAVKSPTPFAAMAREADTCLIEGDYDGAIRTYSTILEQSQLPEEMRLEAYRNRGAAYLSRGKLGDIARAIQDQQNAGLKGTCASIRAATADLKYGAEKRATLREGQVVMLSATQGDWLWVASVDGDSKLTGWISQEAVVEQKDAQKDEKANTSKMTLVQPVSTTTVQPAQWQTVPSYNNGGNYFRSGGWPQPKKRGCCGH